MANATYRGRMIVNDTDYTGSFVDPNPSGVATDDLNTVGIDGKIFNIAGGGGSSVIPNPSGTATATLQKVDIDGTIYEIQGGVEFEYFDYAYNNATNKFLLDLYSSADQQIEFDFKADEYINAMVITGDYVIGSVYYNNIFYMNADRIAVNSFAWTDRHKVVLNNLSNKVTIDGTEVGTYTNYDNTQHVLFGRTTSGGYSFFKGKLYEYKVVDKSTGNNLIWLKPAKIAVAGFTIAQGLYDVVNNVWITGNGLTVGNETS